MLRGPAHQEAPSQRKLSLRLLQRTIYGLGWRYAIFCCAVLSFALLTLLPAQIFRYFTENLPTLDTLPAEIFVQKLLIFGLLVAVAMLIASFGNAYIQEWLRLHLESLLRKKVMRRLHQMPLTQFDSAQRGEWLSRMTVDLQQSEMFLTESIPGQIRHLAVLVGTAVLFVVYSGKLALLPLAAAALVGWTSIIVQRRLAPVLKELRTMHGSVFHQLIESLEGVRTIRSYAAERYVLNRFEQKLSQIIRRGMKVVKSYGALIGANQWISQFMVVLILAILVSSFASGQLSLHQALVYPFFLGLFFSAVQGLSSSSYQWNRFFVEGGRLAQLLYAQPTQGALALNHLTCDAVDSVRLSRVGFGYAKKQLLPSFDFEIKRGEVVAITGHSGCGKSTFLELLAGLRPAFCGSGQLVSSKGQSVWTSAPLLQLPIEASAYVEQHPYIFEGSIEANLSMGNPCDPKHMQMLLSKLGLSKLGGDQGLKYVLSDRGTNLSEGQRYRLALARALLLERPFLLLDEPFAALDRQSISRVVAILKERNKQQGIVLVSHYLPVDLRIDREITLDPNSLKSAPVKLVEPAGMLQKEATLLV